MADWAGFRRPHLGRCAHRDVVSSITAGLERNVCQDCGHVSVRFVAETVKVHNDLTESGDRVSKRAPCGRCERPAEFMIPNGLACPGHAWAAASRQEITGSEIWIPIRIDQKSNAS